MFYIIFQYRNATLKMRYCYKPIRMVKILKILTTNFEKDVELQELLFTAVGNAELYTFVLGNFLPTLKVLLPYNQVIVLLGIYPNSR